MSTEIDVLMEIQKELIRATQEKTIAEFESMQKTKELIEKREESIRLSSETINSNNKIISTIEGLIENIKILIEKSNSMVVLIEKIDILILLTQIMIQIVGKLDGVDKDHVNYLKLQLEKLLEISSNKTSSVVVQTIGFVDSEQANIGENVKGIKNE